MDHIGPSNSAVDRAGRALAKATCPTKEDRAKYEAVLDEYRQSHLEPLTGTTLQVQEWMGAFDGPYYIAQRLKRKPQVIRKLRRLPGRLVQMQDIAGARIVVKSNQDVDRLVTFLKQQVAGQSELTVDGIDDYRAMGREDSGYRALHVIFANGPRKVELQLRSEAQHYWAELIERTSVIYGHHLKELEGDPVVLRYFRILSDVFHELEAGRNPPTAAKIDLDTAREAAEEIIQRADRKAVYNTKVSEGVVKAMIGRFESSPGTISNWLMVFDWNSGSFIYFEPVVRDPSVAMNAYVDMERQYSSDDGFEVVMVGSSDPSMIRHTHSHYFGIETYDTVLESLKESVVGISKRLPIGIDELKVLRVLVRRKHWGKAHMVSRRTLRNNFCPSVTNLDRAIAWLAKEDLVETSGKDGVYLNLSAKAAIEAHL